VASDCCPATGPRPSWPNKQKVATRPVPVAPQSGSVATAAVRTPSSKRHWHLAAAPANVYWSPTNSALLVAGSHATLQEVARSVSVFVSPVMSTSMESYGRSSLSVHLPGSPSPSKFAARCRWCILVTTPKLGASTSVFESFAPPRTPSPRRRSLERIPAAAGSMHPATHSSRAARA